jgi:hypothetical protein
MHPDILEDGDNFDIEMPCQRCGGTQKIEVHDEDFDCANAYADCPDCA